MSQTKEVKIYLAIESLKTGFSLMAHKNLISRHMNIILAQGIGYNIYNIFRA